MEVYDTHIINNKVMSIVTEGYKSLYKCMSLQKLFLFHEYNEIVIQLSSSLTLFSE